MSQPLNILFAGTPTFAAVHLSALLDTDHTVCAVLTQPDRRAGRGKKMVSSPVKQAAMDAGIEVLQPASLKDPAEQQALTAYGADVMVVVAYGLILPQAVLDLPRYGCLNVHASLLPRWRGAAPIQRAIEAGDAESGVTIMQMEAGLDTGPMLATTRLTLDDTMTGGTLHDALAQQGPTALIEVLNDLPGALARAITQDNSAATYAHKIDKADTALDWSKDAAALARQVRAFAPTPGCFSELDGARIKILGAKVLPALTSAAPGTVLAAGRDGINIACGSGVLGITHAQVPGGKPLAVAELLNGQRDRFEPGRAFTAVDS